MVRVIKTKTEFEGRFYERTVAVEGEDIPRWESDHTFSAVGKSQPRIDGKERVTGRAVYTSDVQLPGMLYGKILRCPHPSARIKGLDTEKAEHLPGVHLVLSHRNTPEISWRYSQTVLFDKILRYAGDEIACVVAENETICREALQLIEVSYVILPFVLDPEKALAPGSPAVQESGNLFGRHPESYERGDINKGFSLADTIVEGNFRTQTAMHNCMETHGSVAKWEGDSLILWDSTQNIFGVRDQVCRALTLPQHRVRVIKQYMGGGFGSKNEAGKYTIIAALAARRTGWPVKIMLDRYEENLAAGNRPESNQSVKIGAKNDGTLTAIHHTTTIALGAYASHIASPCGPAKRLYSCSHVKTEDYGAFTHAGPFSSFRAPGYVEGTFALESVIDDLAKSLDMDPLALRLKNYADIDPITGNPYTTKGLRMAYQRGAELIGWDSRKEVKQRESGSTIKVGFGMASQVWGGSGGPPAYAVLKLNPDGSAVVITGTQDIGTGTKTALAQIAAETLGISMSSVSVQLGDTQTGFFSPLSAGSMTLPSMGPAVRGAAEDARRQLIEVASQILGTEGSDLTIEEGLIIGKKTGQSSSIHRVLQNLGNFTIIGRGARAPNPADKNVNTFGAQYAMVNVNIETGKIKIIKIVAVHESGRVINPLTARSQIEGGIIQGIGFALFEQRWLDPHLGALINGDLDHYKLPTIEDVPEMIVEIINLPDPEANSIGAKGLGEPPIIPTAAAIANAVTDAVGVRIRRLPLTPDKVLSALNIEK